METLGAGVIAVAAGGTAIVAIFRLPVVAKPLRWVTKHWREDRDIALGMTIERVIGPRLEILTGELTHNGGGSLKDTVARVESGLNDITQRFDQTFTDRGLILEAHSDQIAALSGDVSTILMKVSKLEGKP